MCVYTNTYTGQFKIYLTSINLKPREAISKGLRWSPGSGTAPMACCQQLPGSKKDNRELSY